MHSVMSCPKCQARLHLAADLIPRRFRCGACGFEFATSNDEPKALDTVAVEELRVQLAKTPALIAPRVNVKAKSVAGSGCFLQMLALTPLSIAALGVPFCRFGTGWTAVVFWSAFGIGLALACIALVRRTRWSWTVRLLITLGLTGAGHMFLMSALAVSFWQWMHVIDPADWRDFAPEGGRFHISVPGTPSAQAGTEQGLPPGSQVYELQLRQQDVLFAISYGDVPLQEWSRLPLQTRFAKSRDGMVARMPGSRVVAEKRITLDRNPGREFHLEIPGKGMMVARVYFVRNRLFVLLIGGSRITPDAEVVAKFLDSFRPDPLDEKHFPPLPLMQQPPDIEEEDIYPGRTIVGYEKEYVTRLILSRDGGTVAAGCRDGTIELWNLGSGKRLGTLHIPLDQPRFALSPDGKTLAVESDEAGCDLKLFAAQTQKEIGRLVDAKMQKEIAARGEGPASVGAIVFSPGGRYLASGHYRGNDVQTIRLWDVPARKPVRTISGGKGWSNVMVFTPDGRYLVHGEGNGIICWLDPLTGGRGEALRDPAQERCADI